LETRCFQAQPIPQLGSLILDGHRQVDPAFALSTIRALLVVVLCGSLRLTPAQGFVSAKWEATNFCKCALGFKLSFISSAK